VTEEWWWWKNGERDARWMSLLLHKRRESEGGNRAPFRSRVQAWHLQIVIGNQHQIHQHCSFSASECDSFTTVMDDDFGGDDVDFHAVIEASERSRPSGARPAPRLDAPREVNTSNGVQQPKPQEIKRKTQSSILVSPRQKGNPILNSIRAMPWEYADIPADYVLGQTTCALFLSLKYHRLHPEYIYSRIRALQGKYGLRVVLTMVDIDNHEEPLKELSKTSLINNVTIILTWSAQEAGRYLELFKSYEHATPTAIQAHQSTNYADKLVDFVTVPRGINKTDAVNLISSFGSVRTAVNARPEEVALLPGWGEKKVQRWCSSVKEPFRINKAARRGLSRDDSTPGISREQTRAEISREETEQEPVRDEAVAARLGIASSVPMVTASSTAPALTDKAQFASDVPMDKDADEDEELALLEAQGYAQMAQPSQKKAVPQKSAADSINEGIAAALEKYRQQ